MAAEPGSDPSTRTPPARRWARVSLRARLTLVSTGLLALALFAGGVLLVAALRSSFLASLDDAARQQAAQVAQLVDTGRLPDPVPVVGATAAVQVVDAQGRVRSSSVGGDRLVALLEPAEVAQVREGAARVLPGYRLGGSSPLRVVGLPAGPAADPQTVLVAVPLGQLEGSVRTLLLAVAVGAPLLLAVLAAVTWVVVGSALRPVDALRRGAQEITGAGVDRRLPVPAAEDEVRRLALTLNDMLARLEAGGARQRAFVADAAHELRSPLASLRTQLEVAQRHPGAADWRDVADDVLADAYRMARIVGDLLLLARLDEDRLTVGPTDLVALADDAAARLGAAARVPVSRADPPGLVTVPVAGDAGALSRVVSNLVDNAVRHAATGVTVTVEGPGAGPVGGTAAGRVSRSGHGGPGWAVLTVSDDGPGIPAADRERVFERFTRLDAARSRDEGGSGLGLAIVRTVVARHGGTVTLAEAGPGLRVVVRLPAEQVIEAVIRTTVP